MCAFIKCSCAITFLKLVTCISVAGLNHVKSNGEVEVIETFGPYGSGFFERLLESMLDILSNNYNGRLLVAYCKVLSGELSNLNFRYTTELAKHLKRLSKLYRADLMAEMQGYRSELAKKQPHLKEFLNAVNDVLPLELSIQFRKYVRDVKDFGTEAKRDIKAETRSILNAIVGAVEKLPTSKKKQIERKFKMAVRERKRSDLDPYLQSLFEFSKS